MNQRLLEKYLCNAMKNTDGAMCPSYRLKQSIHCSSLSAMFNSLHSSMNQELFEKHLCNHGSHYKKTISIMQRKQSHATTKSTLFTVSKDEWNTKENIGKSLKNLLDVLRYAKRLKQH